MNWLSDRTLKTNVEQIYKMLFLVITFINRSIYWLQIILPFCRTGREGRGGFMQQLKQKSVICCANPEYMYTIEAYSLC